MSGLAPFAAALTAADRHLPPGLAAPSTRRFAVYRNNVAVGLIRTLETRFPALLSLVGEEFFRAMAREFTLAHPPASPLLMTFGDDLPNFIAGFAPAAEFPYLADIARIEIARTRAYHAPDVPRLRAEAFATLTPQQIEAVRVEFHPAVAIVRSVHPVWTILAMASGWEAASAAIDDWRPQAVLVDRPQFDTLVRPLPAGDALFIGALITGDPLGLAAATAMAAAAEFNLPAALADLIGAGLAIGLDASNGGLP